MHCVGPLNGWTKASAETYSRSSEACEVVPQKSLLRILWILPSLWLRWYEETKNQHAQHHPDQPTHDRGYDVYIPEGTQIATKIF